MRVRQAIAMHKAKLILKKDDTRQAAKDALAPLADSLKKLDAEPSEWDRRLVADLHTLHSVGIHTVESMLCHNRTNVLPHMALMSIMGRRKVSPNTTPPGAESLTTSSQDCHGERPAMRLLTKRIARSTGDSART
jgi:hypothetical protein